MFAGADKYDNGGQALSTGVVGWITTNVTDMSQMFQSAYVFNQLVSWNTENVTLMTSMFSYAKKFDQDISNWDVSGCGDFYYMFDHAEVFNQDIRSWVVYGNPQPTSNMFYAGTPLGPSAFLAVYGCSAAVPVPYCINDIPPYTGAPPCHFFVSPDCLPPVYPSINTVGGEFIFQNGGGWSVNTNVEIRVNQDPYLLKNVDPNGGIDKYVGFSASSIGDPYILYCTPEGPPTYIPNQGTPGARGLRLPVSNTVPPHPIKFQVEIDLPTAGWTDMGQCDIWMASSFNAGVPPRCTLLVAFPSLNNPGGTGEDNGAYVGNWISVGAPYNYPGTYIGQTIRITYVSGGT